MQPGLAAENTYAVDQLGEIGVKMQRAILMVTCNSPQITTFSTDLRLYSSVSYDKL